MNYFGFGGKRWPLGEKTYIMGILNVTPDSFSDGGLFCLPEKALARALQAQSEGADILDIGAESTRPGNKKITPEEEWERLSPVLDAILPAVHIPLSADTYHIQTAERCLDRGVQIINDVSGIFHPDKARLIKKYNAGWCLMHGGVESGLTEDENNYPLGVVNHIQLFFDEMLQKAEAFGIPKENILLDPGFGFGKTAAQNTELLKNLKLLQSDGAPLLAALSRKRFIGAITGDKNPQERLYGTLAADIYAALSGADMIRVHDVAEHKKALCLTDALGRNKTLDT